MAGKVMGYVFTLDVELRPEDLLVLLAYADHAHADGTGIFPGVKLIAKKTRHCERSVQYSTRRLADLGLLMPDGKGPHGTNQWRIPVPWATGDTDDTPNGAIDFTPEAAGMVQRVAPVGQEEGVQPGTRMVQPVSLDSARAVAPKPSGTAIEPSPLVKRASTDRSPSAPKSDEHADQPVEHVPGSSAGEVLPGFALVQDALGRAQAASVLQLEVPTVASPKRPEGLASMYKRLFEMQSEQTRVSQFDQSPLHDQHVADLAAKRAALEAKIKAREKGEAGPSTSAKPWVDGLL